MNLEVIILAAGKGTRMRSALPKVLHPIAGRPMLAHVIETARSLSPAAIHVVYGHGGEHVRESISDPDLHWVEQDRQLGTGHAVEQAMPAVSDEATVLVLYGDVPLITRDTLDHLLQNSGEGIGLLTVMLADPRGYGRIVRDAEGRVVAIVEQKDASGKQLQIDEGNTGILACNGGRLRSWLRQLDNDNAQGEFYLTDVIALAERQGLEVTGIQAHDEMEVAGINDRVQLARLERVYQQRCAEALMRRGVTIIDPARFDQRGHLQAGEDCLIDVGCIFEGEVTLGNGVEIGANCLLRNVRIGDNVRIEPMSVLEDAVIDSGCSVGPFARLRPGTHLAQKARVGNFVEVKNSEIGAGSKVNHLSYIGDTQMGSEVNIGAGTITCNYDGANKHRTVIGDRVFVGSDSQLVAPVAIGDGATIGAGSTITRDVPEEMLTLSRSGQKSIKEWKRPVKKGSDK
ncbi:MAG: bifunctional UDP-N-acetylglucosamine diphosphorylase/glucosamine-1-phosphate N-acetyltransferase GlmU [Gammaproteobacteria bacterium]|nr:bifunctional UDP-N-acetylglucosamine diphosphorylase/glucosamine-1-phosphate N-acetyltransferase GlmU [Gammaproteobacteria bacterium]MCW8958054.1 bifunctional UDP-N-acetylglucosamine diphosphorylase/glucosamine-1-phosphate N-acetyltransferase GlmU [Gammaproteobacteria bacterium]MCW8992291.1 bifunctional UDP-N-acetylglucosamine diphosphorylase/glucosamine-1-phosphate N-acetyltransferase GlmU [Gammaproteobacteria bacterium]